MRLAIVNRCRHKIGGAESYLTTLISALYSAGHQLSFTHEYDIPTHQLPLFLPSECPTWDISKLGEEKVLSSLMHWRPNLILANGLDDALFEAKVFAIAPVVFVGHNYHGTCISGSKTQSLPTIRPCQQRFGLKCLLHYYPRRCGGLNPLTMVELYRLQSQRSKNLSLCKAIVTFSDWMKEEFVRSGYLPEIVYKLSMPIDNFDLNSSSRCMPKLGPIQLLFLGRMDDLKGGEVLIDALPSVCERLGREIKMVFAGEGPSMPLWQKKCDSIQNRYPLLKVEFPGWIKDEFLEKTIERSHLLVVPSLWPEPFGMVGMEVAAKGIPCAAFAVGGITEWLVDGVNGYFAIGAEATSSGLTQAIVKCLQEKDYENLSQGAIQMAKRFDPQFHIQKLTAIFDKVLA